MAKKDKQEEARRQAKWKEEKARIEERRKVGPKMKAHVRAKGCNLPFYDGIDSAEEEFHRLVVWAKEQCRSLHAVFEAEGKLIDDAASLGLPADWEQVTFDMDDQVAESYLARDSKANLRGMTVAFRDAKGEFHTVILVIKNPDCSFEHKENKYLLKLPILLHEIGHVKDHEGQINFKRDTNRVDMIEAEVYANIFALQQSFARAYYLSGEMFLDAIISYKDDKGYRGEVTRRVVDQFKKPEYREWGEFVDDDETGRIMKLS
jgi:hypothetical protein